MKKYLFFSRITKQFAEPILSESDYAELKCPVGFELFSITKI